ncbi:MAG TPA: type II secretion system protein [Steroidobacteraceae bacterium]|nr:type II secretion system protein [Steroidobacteraceae bacterium]
MSVVAPAQRGFTYLGILFAVVIMGIMLTAATRVWTLTEQRERETQLLFVGHEFRNAIGSYVAKIHRYPQTLQDLLGENDSTLPQRFLRRLYLDPMTGAADWRLIEAPGGGFMGVASSSQGKPIKHTNFLPLDESFVDADCYCGWQFIYQQRYRHVNPPAGTAR